MPPSEPSSGTSFFGRISARSSFISSKEVKVSVQLLDDSETITHEFKRSDPAQAILDYVCEVLNIREKDYFGLRYQDQHKHRYWVDLSRSIDHIHKQFKFSSSDNLALRLRFRFYPNDPHLLKEEITRYQLFVQLQRDLLHGRLHCPHALSAQLASLIIQSQLGDFDPEVHGENYVSEYKLLLKQTPKMEEKIAELHKQMSGTLSASEAELEFLEKACQLDTYGFDPYTVKDGKDPSKTVYLGVTHRGVLAFMDSVKTHHIPWSQLSKVDYISKEVRVLPTEEYIPPVAAASGSDTSDQSLVASKKDAIKTTQGKPNKKHRLVVKVLCPNGVYAKHLWTHILSQQAFFNDMSASQVKPKFSKPRIPLLSRGSTFRFPSRRVLKEIESSIDEEEPRQNVTFSRYQLPRQEPRKEVPWLNKYHTLPATISSNSNSLKANGTAARAKADNKENENKISLLDEMARLVQERSDVAEALREQRGHQVTTTEQTGTTPDSVQAGPSHSSGSSQNTAQFTIKLVKFEKSPPASPEPEALGGLSLSDEFIGEPLATSTPAGTSDIRGSMKRRASDAVDEVACAAKRNGAMPNTSDPETFNVEVGGDERLTENVVADEKQHNGELLKSNGVGHHAGRSVSTSSSSGSLISKVAHVFFVSFLLILLLVAVSIAVFEKSKTSSDDWVESVEVLSRVRHQFYEPIRHTVLNAYGRYVGK